MSVNATNCKCTFVLALLLAVLPFELHAQAPESFSYQAVIRDGSGQILANQPAEVRIVLHSGTIGNVVYQENHTITTSQFGLFTLEIGRGIPQIGSFNSLNWGSGSYFLQVEVETDSSVGYINLGATQLLSVPYALYAKEAGSAPSVVYTGGTAIEVTGTYPNFTINNIAPDQTVTLTGTGATQVSGVYPNFNISSTDNDNQTLSITGNNLSISGGNSVTLPSGGGSGTITGVTAGTGLTGGGTIGNVTLNAQSTSPIWNAGQVQGRTVAPTAPASGQVLKWNTNTQQWEPANDIGGGSGDNWGTQVVQSDATLTGDGTSTSPLQLAPQGAQPGQVLKWNGTTWVPAVDNNTTYTGGTGIQITGTTITNTGDTNPNDDITIGSPAGGDLSGTYPNPMVDGLQGRPVAANAPASGQVLKWNGSAWAPATDQGKNYIAGQGIAINGDTIVNTVQLLTDLGDVNTAGAQPGQVLKWNGTTWVPAQDNTSSGGAGAVSVTPRLTGDGSSGSPLDIAQQGATTGQVLKWNGTTWVPDNDQGQVYTAGTGISISGGVITNTGDTNPNDDITDTTQAGGDLSGTFSNLQIVTGAVGSTEIADGSIQAIDIAPGVIPTTLPPSGAAGGDLGGNYPNPGVTKLQGNPVGTTAPASGQVLKWDGTAWIPSADETTTDTSHWEKSGNFVYLLSDSVGIGTSTPLAGLHVKDSLDVLFGATMSGGSGPRLMWIADKGAFRAGMAQGPSWDTDSIGFRSVAFGFNTTAIGSYTTALGFQSTARGSNATAMGNNTLASASNSTAMGSNTTASGNYSTAMGLSTTASGVWSTAMGSNTTASGFYSTAMGDNTDAKSGFEIVIGRYNTAYTPNSTSSWNLNDRLFTLGNGTSSTDRSDAMVVLKNGNTGIMVSNPEVGLHVRDSVDVLFGDTMSGGSGPRLMWIADKGAFRAGRVPNASWDMDSIGIQSVALGFNTKAKGQYSTAMGYSTTASGIYSTALGISTTASGHNSVAMGNNTTASGSRSTAMGDYTTASGSNSVAMGVYTTASGYRSTAMGASTTASGNYSTAMGQNTTASGAWSTAMGINTTASGNYSTAMGDNTNAKSAYETVLGRYNTDYTPNSTTSWDTSDRLFTIGNGTSTSARSNAMVVLKDGKTGIGTSNPDMLLEVSGSGYQAARVTSTNGNRASIEFKRTGGGSDWRIMDSIGFLWIGQSSDDLASVNEVVRLGGSSLTPASDNFATLGASGLRWTTVYAVNGTINTSDARDKESVADLSSGLAQVMQLRPVTYRWKEGRVDNQRTHIGFLAQDLLETIPEVVVTHEWREGPEGTEREWVEAEKLGVNYSELIPVLTKAIQEQQVIIEQLQERLEALEQQ